MTVSAHIRDGDALRFANDLPGAMARYREALAVNPDSADARFRVGLTCLTLGDYVPGWSEYRYRYRTTAGNDRQVASDKPLWEGEPLDGKTLMLIAEQGDGDLIMFARFFAVVKRRWACALWLSCEPRMTRLMRCVPAIDRVCEGLPNGYDVIVPVMDLPFCLGVKSEADIPPAQCFQL